MIHRLGALIAHLMVLLGNVSDSEAQTSRRDLYILSALRDGVATTREEAAALEETLKANPDDLASRARLLGFYYAASLEPLGAEASIEGRRRHILWLIERHPGSPLAAAPEATIDRSGHALADPKGFAAGRRAWLAHIERGAPPGAIIRHAVNFLQLHDKPLAERLLLQATAREPGNRTWSRELGRLFALGILRVNVLSQSGRPLGVDGSDDAFTFARHARETVEASGDLGLVGSAGVALVRLGAQLHGHDYGHFSAAARTLAERSLARAQEWSGLAQLAAFERRMATTLAARLAATRKALALLERVYRDLTPAQSRLAFLIEERMPQLAYEAEDRERAAALARELLVLAAALPHDAAAGRAIHEGNTLLGRLALSADDIVGAKSFLLSAGRTPGDPTLAVEGPRLDLAAQLVARGERTTVIEYLQLCKRFWPEGRRSGRLDEWIKLLRRGGIPDFSAATDR